MELPHNFEQIFPDGAPWFFSHESPVVRVVSALVMKFVFAIVIVTIFVLLVGEDTSAGGKFYSGSIVKPL